MKWQYTHYYLRFWHYSYNKHIQNVTDLILCRFWGMIIKKFLLLKWSQDTSRGEGRGGEGRRRGPVAELLGGRKENYKLPAKVCGASWEINQHGYVKPCRACTALHDGRWTEINQITLEGESSTFIRDIAQLHGGFVCAVLGTGLPACSGRSLARSLSRSVGRTQAAMMCVGCSTKLRRGSESFTGWWTGTTRPPALRTRWLHQHRP